MSILPALRRSAAQACPVAPWLLLLACTGLVGCDRGKKEETPPSSPAPSAETEKKPASPPLQEAIQKKMQGSAEPVGPTLVILPGTGVDAVRFGTNLKKLQQLMGASCDILTETRCVYVDRAAEFTLKDGVVSGMKFHRRGRVVSEEGGKEPRYYGSFNGGMRPNLMFGLHRHIVEEEYGAPKKKEPLAGPDGQVERHIYDGVILEYDRLENQNIVLAGIEVIPATQEDAPAPKAAGSAPAPKAAGSAPAPKAAGSAPAPKAAGSAPAPKAAGSKPAPAGSKPAPPATAPKAP